MRDDKLGKIEALRGFASCYVFAGHLLLSSLGQLDVLLRFGQEIVICFFLLSGFVIYYSTVQARGQNYRSYFIRRFRRIYPTFLIACLLAWIIMILKGHPLIDWRTLLGNLLMLQDSRAGKPGVWFDVFGDNLPLWSLSYEWWFYLLFFPIYTYVPARYQLGLVAALSLTGLMTYVALPNQISLFLLYFILWWTGLEFARTYCQGVTPTFFTQRHSLAVLGGFCLLVPLALIFLMPPPSHWVFGYHPLLEIRHFWACFFLAVLSLLWSRAGWRYFQPILGWFAYVAPISYALYAFHFPICVCSRSIGGIYDSPWMPIGAVALTLVLAYLVEVPLQNAIVKWSNRVLLSGKKARQEAIEDRVPV